MTTQNSLNHSLTRTVFIVALGYLVDVYDLIIFGIVRVSSLKDLGFSGDELFNKGVLLINAQSFGLIVGGIICGVMADKLGRVPALFGSIFLYSAANVANGFVHSLDIYVICRFLAGVGLAGELGIGMTLVSESLPTESRSHAATFISFIGVMGAVVASVVNGFFSWRVAYCVGGGLGLILMFSRYRLIESKAFLTMIENHTPRGKLRDFFHRETLSQYGRCLLIGIPAQFVIGILVVFSPEILTGRVPTPVPVGNFINCDYVGMAVGAVVAAYFSQKIKSRRRVILGFLVNLLVLGVSYLLLPYQTYGFAYVLCFLLGIACGYWPIFVLFSAESFGVNIRASATSTISNFIRGALIGLNLLFAYLKTLMGAVNAALFLCILVSSFAILGMWGSRETDGRDLNFLENE